MRPNPTELGNVNQSWNIRELNGVGMRIDSIRLDSYSSSGSFISTQKLTDSNITQLWESTYLPELYVDTGTIQLELLGEPGGHIFIHLFGHDDNRYFVSSSDTLLVL